MHLNYEHCYISSVVLFLSVFTDPLYALFKLQGTLKTWGEIEKYVVNLYRDWD